MILRIKSLNIKPGDIFMMHEYSYWSTSVEGLYEFEYFGDDSFLLSGFLHLKKLQEGQPLW